MVWEGEEKLFEKFHVCMYVCMNGQSVSQSVSEGFLTDSLICFRKF